MIRCTSLDAAPTRRVLPLNDPRGVPCGCRDQSPRADANACSAAISASSGRHGLGM
jgi:hypothetical protein